MIKPVAILLLFFTCHCYANTLDTSIYLKKGKQLLLTDEKFVAALQFFTEELNTATKNNKVENKAETIYWIAECLFQVRKLNELKHVIDVGEIFLQKEHLYKTYAKLMQVKAKYLIDICNTKDAIELLRNNDYIDDTFVLINNKLIIADAYYRIGELETSKNIYNYIIKYGSDSIQIAQAYNDIGSIYYMLSSFDKASYYYNKSYLLYKNKLGLLNTKIAQVQQNLCLIANNKGDYNMAQQFAQAALKCYKIKLGDYSTRTAEAYGVLGSVYKLQDDLEKSILCYNKERDILSNIYGENNEKQIYCHLNLGEVYTITKNYKKANDEIEKAIYFTKKLNYYDCNLYTQCIVKLCCIKTLEKDYKTSNKLLLALIMNNKNYTNDYIADAYHQLGINYLEQKKFNDAIYNFEFANKLYLQYFGDKNVYSIDPLIEISNTFLEQENAIAALKYAQLALEQTEENYKIIYPYDHWECMVQILKCKKKLYLIQPTTIDVYKNEIDLIKQTILEAKKIKQTYYSSGSQMLYAEKMSELHKLGIFYLTHFYKKADSYFLNNLLYFADNNKANLLRYKISTDASNQLLPIEERNKLYAITDQLNNFITLNENQENVAYNINDSILFYQNLYESFTKHIEKKYPKVYTIKYGQQPFSLKEIQKKINDDYTFLNYCNDDENYYCIAISKKNITYKICGIKNKIDLLIKNYQTNLINLKFNKEINKQLSTILLPKKLNKNLLIASDGMLQSISFDVLYDTTNQYLIYNHTVQYTFSTNTYFKHQTEKQNKNSIAFFPNFTNTKYAVLNYNQEQKCLQNFPNYTSLQNTIATKQSFLKEYKKANIIHIASHLIIDTISPLNSSLLFQPNNDNTLTINDIWKLNANAQLITLAACYSNFGKIQNGEGMQNFAWAFQYAGAHNVLSTQWNASDKSTAAIICDFYNKLQHGKTKEEALRLAKLKFINNADAVSIQPFFWANYCIYADETEIKIKQQILAKYWWCLFIILPIVTSIFLRIKK